MASALTILHTSDWHLGHSLIGMSRAYEHDQFLQWLLATIAETQPDALIIAGDIFDSANPPAVAQRQWYQFLAAAAKRTHDHFQIVVIGGNHDSAARLNAPKPLLDAFGIHVIGGVLRTPDRALDVARMIVPLRDRSGDIRAWCAAMPYIRVPDLPRVDDEAAGDVLVEGVRRLYAELLAPVFARRAPGQAVIATGHCYMTGTQLSELSERKILVGNQHALPADIFTDALAYVALGHLHKPQTVGGRDWIRYSGAPIPLSMGEADYRNQVCLAEFSGERLASVEGLPVPRAVAMLRLPEAPLPEALDQLAELPPRAADVEEHRRPYLEARIRLDKPEPGLLRRLQEAVADKEPRLIKIVPRYTGQDLRLGGEASSRGLNELDPDEVFLSRYRQYHEGEPPEAYRAMFRELVERAERGGS